MLIYYFGDLGNPVKCPSMGILGRTWAQSQGRKGGGKGVGAIINLGNSKQMQ